MIRLTNLLCTGIVLTFTGYLSAEETKGTVKSVDTGRKELVVKGIIENSTYVLDKDAYVCLDGAKGKLSDLREGDHVVITYEKRGDHLMAGEIRGLRNSKETTGTVREVYPEKREITLKGVIMDTTYELNKDATVWLDGQKATLADIRVGDHVMLTYRAQGDHNATACVRASRKQGGEAVGVPPFEDMKRRSVNSMVIQGLHNRSLEI